MRVDLSVKLTHSVIKYGGIWCLISVVCKIQIFKDIPLVKNNLLDFYIISHMDVMLYT